MPPTGMAVFAPPADVTTPNQYVTVGYAVFVLLPPVSNTKTAYPTVTYWFGVVTSAGGANTAMPVGGILTPFYENATSITVCPVVYDPPLKLVYGWTIGCYAYNRHLG